MRQAFLPFWLCFCWLQQLDLPDWHASQYGWGSFSGAHHERTDFHAQPAGSNKAWVERRAKAVSRGIGMGAAVMAAKAENSEIWDIEGNRYIDFGGGIAVVNTGHRHPLVMRRVYEQLEKVTHTCAMVMPYTPFIEVCEKLNAVAPI